MEHQNKKLVLTGAVSLGAVALAAKLSDIALAPQVTAASRMHAVQLVEQATTWHRLAMQDKDPITRLTHLAFAVNSLRHAQQLLPDAIELSRLLRTDVEEVVARYEQQLRVAQQSMTKPRRPAAAAPAPAAPAPFAFGKPKNYAAAGWRD